MIVSKKLSSPRWKTCHNAPSLEEPPGRGRLPAELPPLADQPSVGAGLAEEGAPAASASTGGAVGPRADSGATAETPRAYRSPIQAGRDYGEEEPTFRGRRGARRRRTAAGAIDGDRLLEVMERAEVREAARDEREAASDAKYVGMWRWDIALSEESIELRRGLDMFGSRLHQDDLD